MCVVLCVALDRFKDGALAAGRRCVLSRIGDCDATTFVDLVTYLYTMHAPIEEHDLLGLIALVGRSVGRSRRVRVGLAAR